MQRKPLPKEYNLEHYCKWRGLAVDEYGIRECGEANTIIKQTNKQLMRMKRICDIYYPIVNRYEPVSETELQYTYLIPAYEEDYRLLRKIIDAILYVEFMHYFDYGNIYFWGVTVNSNGEYFVKFIKNKPKPGKRGN
jgi:hypothetical protein